MSLHGKRDLDAEQRRIEKAQANGFGQKGVAGRPKKDSTEVWENRSADRMPEIVDKSIDAILRALRSDNEKTALDAAAKAAKIFHRPTQNVNVEGMNHQELHLHMAKQQDQLSAADREIMGDFLDVLRQGAEKDMLELDAEEVGPEELTSGE